MLICFTQPAKQILVQSNTVICDQHATYKTSFGAHHLVSVLSFSLIINLGIDLQSFEIYLRALSFTRYQ